MLSLLFPGYSIAYVDEVGSSYETGWQVSRKKVEYSLSGELELEYVDSGKDAATPGSHFQIDKFTLIPYARIDENTTFGSLLLFKSNTARVDEVYIKFDRLAYDSQFKIGMDDRITNEWPKRRTEAFALIDSAFARDDELGLTWSRSRNKPFFWSVTLSNGYALGKIAPSEDKSYEFLHDNRQTTDQNQNKSVGVGLGGNLIHSNSKQLGVMVYAYKGQLSSDDITVLQSITGYPLSLDNTNERYGVALNGRSGQLNYGLKTIRATDGLLERDGFFVQSGYSFKLSGEWVKTIEPFIRYGQLNVDLANDSNDSLTWDREMTTLALLLGIRKNFKIKVEYYLNAEDTGGAEVDNDEFVVQFEAKF